MFNPLNSLRTFLRALGPVEQAQMVASTAVVVTMATIITAMAATGQSPRFMDFISIVTVGIIGFTSVYFSLLNSRRLDDQRRQLLALNTVAEAVNRVMELDDVLRTALGRITDVLDARWGWIYLTEGNSLVLRCVEGTKVDFFSTCPLQGMGPEAWLGQSRSARGGAQDQDHRMPAPPEEPGFPFWTSMPLQTKNNAVGVLIIAGESTDMFGPKQVELMEAFGNQISVAVHTARLFERLHQSEQQYADLFENAPDLYLSVNREHTVISCNRHGADLLGVPKHDIVGRAFSSLFLASRQEVVDAMLDRMFADGRGVSDVEEQMVSAPGKPFSVLLNSSLVIDQHGHTVTARIVARDITERKRMEGALLHAQKIDSIGNLAGGIAHDFNNILAAILGSASIMRRHLNDRARLTRYVEIIESSARRGSSLTRQLLTFARKAETIAAPVDIHALIHETLDLYQRSVTKDITVHTSLTAAPVTVNGDDGQIQQALLNLLLNARDAMPERGTITITTDIIHADSSTVSRFLSVRPGPFVEIRVADTGRGIPRALQERIFEPFFTTKDNGTGLGLSVVYGVVQNHGGFVNLESEEGQGTTFSLFFPQHAESLPGGKRKQRSHIPRGTEHILVVDDEPAVLEVARDILAHLGYTIYVASNGHEGVEFYRTRRASIDLVLLDVNMPVMSGIEAFEQLRSLDPRVRVIIVTGYGKGVIEAPRFSSEVNGFVQKPFLLETLATKVRKVLDMPTFGPEPIRKADA
jgi:PAS domain S-box-containing protein